MIALAPPCAAPAQPQGRAVLGSPPHPPMEVAPMRWSSSWVWERSPPTPTHQGWGVRAARQRTLNSMPPPRPQLRPGAAAPDMRCRATSPSTSPCNATIGQNCADAHCGERCNMILASINFEILFHKDGPAHLHAPNFAPLPEPAHFTMKSARAALSSRSTRLQGRGGQQEVQPCSMPRIMGCGKAPCVQPCSQTRHRFGCLRMHVQIKPGQLGEARQLSRTQGKAVSSGVRSTWR